MAFYIRYFDAEALLQNEEEIVPFIGGLNLLNPREMDVLKSYMGKLKGGTNRIFLDKTKKKYILAIGTDKTDISEFQKNAKKDARPQQKVVGLVRVDNLEFPIDRQIEGWAIFSMDYQRLEEGNAIPYTFKAKIKDACLLSAYDQMAAYLEDQHHEKCHIPEFRPNLLTFEVVKE